MIKKLCVLRCHISRCMKFYNIGFKMNGLINDLINNHYSPDPLGPMMAVKFKKGPIF